jgi:hydrogenase maturation protein HypF
MPERFRLHIDGIVQGVGFRPFIYNLAVKLGLTGWVKNTAQGVFLEIEGEKNNIGEFINTLREKGPLLARVDKVEARSIPAKGETDFRILESTGGERATLVSPDMAICADCLKELYDKQDRRFQYPFINCTNCGPRFTIIRQIPYDRKYTTMKEFPLCQACLEEYHNPGDRRFHAQPNACPDCGPCISLRDHKGKTVKTDNIWSFVQEKLKAGHIFAVKGLGGYHLCCDGFNDKAVKKLRRRKIRWGKPFALMINDVETAGHFCHVNEAERGLLESPRRPIVLLRKKKDLILSEEIAPGNNRLGVMLPYSGFHYLLMETFKALVMTSGNISDEPIVYEDEEALERLNVIADYFLMHNRRIFRRCDDSVVVVPQDQVMMIRRARGYAPEPLKVPFKMPQVLACGSQQKNTFCLTKGNKAFMSNHIGDLDSVPNLINFEQSVEQWQSMFEIKPEIIAYDMHPEYLSTKYAMDYPGAVKKIPVQHHHAHVISCLADNEESGPVIGVSFDGTGYGTDGALWGGEFLICQWESFTRAGHISYVLMPSGDMAVRQPWRMALSYLYGLFGEEMSKLKIDFIQHLPHNWPVLKECLKKKINSPLTSSCGRLFDGVAALVGIRDNIDYEGQAAVELEQIIDTAERSWYPFTIKEGIVLEIDWKPIIRDIVVDLEKGTGTGSIAGKFHNTVSRMIVETCLLLREQYRLHKVALTGGVFQNLYLLNKTITDLKNYGFHVLTHSRVPPNDGGVSLGQALIACHQYGNLEKGNA